MNKYDNIYIYIYKYMRVNMKDKELVEYLIPHWKWEWLFLLIVVINGLICITSNIGLNTFIIYLWKLLISSINCVTPAHHIYV